MFKKLWAFISGDSVREEVSSFSIAKDTPRYLYSAEMIAQLNAKRRYQLIANNSQTEIFIVDTLYKQRVARLYDISYALLVADSLNKDIGGDE